MFNKCAVVVLRPNGLKYFLRMHSSLPKRAATVSNEFIQNDIKPFDEIPGPKSYPFIGSVLEMKVFGGDLDFMNYGDVCKKLQEKYGDLVRFNIFNQRQVFISDPEMVKKIYQNEGDSPWRQQIEPISLYFKKKGKPNTLVTSNGEEWRKLRSASNPVAARPQSVNLFFSKHNEIADEFMEILKSKFDNKQSTVVDNFDIQLKLSALEMVSIIAFDQRIHCIDEKNSSPFATKAVENVDNFIYLIGQLIFSLPFWKIFPTKDWKKFEASADVVYSISAKYVNEAYDKIKEKGDDFKQDLSTKTILQQYLLTKDKYGLTIDDIVALTSDFLIGGIDTTSTTLHFILYALGIHKQVQDKLYEEINANYSLNEPLTKENIDKMNYLKATVKETFRRYPIIPANARIAKQDFVLNNFLIPKGTMLNMSTMYITRSERFFKNPDVFDPSRWLKEEKDNQQIHPYSHLPFGFGARQCIGRRIAEQEMYIFLAKLIKNFEVEYVGEEIGQKTKLIIAPDKPLKLKLTKRQTN